MSTRKFHLKYPGSTGWLIFWMIVFFPIGVVLLRNLRFVSNTHVSSWKYPGDSFWLYFWSVFFFPATVLLLIFKGSLVIKTK